MKSFVDNTTIHSIHRILDLYNKSKPIRQIDAITLLHFTEQILFSEKMEVSTFETSEIYDVTQNTFYMLEKLGCINSSENNKILELKDFTNEEYSKACINAAPIIQEDLQTLDKESLKLFCKLADESSRPIRKDISVLDKWLYKPWNKQKIDDVIEKALDKKAMGAFDYTMASNQGLHHQFLTLTKEVKKSSELPQILNFISIFFRVAINQQLAKTRNSIYSPAPQRANAIQSTDKLFRHSISKIIEDQVRKEKIAFPSKLIDKIQKDEILPLPLFAIHFLRKEKIKNPIELLESASILRNDKEVKEIRNWLSKWELLYGSNDLNERKKSIDKLNEISNFLNIKNDKPYFYNIFRGTFSANPDGSFSFSPDFSGFGKTIPYLFQKFSRRKIFLSNLSSEYKYDKNIGSDLNKILGVAII